MTIQNFQQAKQLLETFVPKKWSASQPYKLDRMVKLMKYLGDPQDTLKIIHIAGTSGKTSTAYFAAALLRKTGLKIGLTVSPHISEINERLQINMMPLAEEKYCAELGEFIDLLSSGNIQPTYFELLVAFAFWEFARQEVDYAVVEVGLGGLLDGTNVINRQDKVCIITDIGLDHTQVLGTTLPEIAKQKAGIIKDRNAVFCYLQDKDVNEVINAVCQVHQANLVALDSSKMSNNYDLLPIFQRRNFGLALVAVNYVIERDRLGHLGPDQINEAAHTHIPARMEIFHRNGKIVIIDGAHNAQKLSALVAAIKDQYPDSSVAALISFVSGREDGLNASLKELASLTHQIIVTAFSGQQDTPKRSVEPSEIVKASQELGLDISVIKDPEKALTELENRPEPVLLITGSFYLLNHIRPLMLKS